MSIFYKSTTGKSSGTKGLAFPGQCLGSLGAEPRFYSLSRALSLSGLHIQ